MLINVISWLRIKLLIYFSIHIFCKKNFFSESECGPFRTNPIQCYRQSDELLQEVIRITQGPACHYKLSIWIWWLVWVRGVLLKWYVEYLITKNDPDKVLTPIDQPLASNYILPSMLFAALWCQNLVYQKRN